MWLLYGVLLIVMLAALLAAPFAAALIALTRGAAQLDIAYADGERQRLDLYQPRGARDAPVIVFFYGGSWQRGDKGLYRLLAGMLMLRGYVVVIPDYRLYPEVRFPDFLIDGAKALRWTHDNVAEFGGDPRSLFVMGFSAGAYNAAMLALDPQWLGDVGLDAARDISGLVGLAGPYDFLPIKSPTLIDLFGGAGRASTQPTSFVAGHKPPALLIAGDADRLVDPNNSVRLAEAMRRNGNDATVRIYRRLGHLTLLLGFVAPWSFFFPLGREVRDFVACVRREKAQRAPAYAGAAAS